MKRNWPGAVWLCAILSVAAGSAAYAAQVSNLTIPVASSFFDGCTGDAVNLTGNVHLRIAFTISSNGGRHLSISTNYDQVREYDTVTGITCAGHANERMVINSDAGAPFELTNGVQVGLECPGPANNTLLKGLQHVAIDAAGNVTSSVDNFSSACGK